MLVLIFQGICRYPRLETFYLDLRPKENVRIFSSLLARPIEWQLASLTACLLLLITAPFSMSKKISDITNNTLV